jgi:RNA polymerase sigma-70 factor (ECF subfamily)
MTDERFAEAARRWMDTVFRLAYSYTKNREDADDVTQEVLLALWREEKEFSSEEHLRNWLIRVTLNRCKALFRSPWRRRESLEDYAETLGFEQPEHTELFLAVMGLERKYRLPLLLYYFFGYSVREIGGLLQLPENTVSTRLYRARAKLRDQLTEE